MTSYDNHLILTCVWWIEVKRVVKFCTHVTRCEEVYESLWVSWSIVVQKTSDWNLRMMTCCLRGQKRSSFYSDCAWKVRRQSGTRTIKTSRNSLCTLNPITFRHVLVWYMLVGSEMLQVYLRSEWSRKCIDLLVKASQQALVLSMDVDSCVVKINSINWYWGQTHGQMGAWAERSVHQTLIAGNVHFLSKVDCRWLPIFRTLRHCVFEWIDCITSYCMYLKTLEYFCDH